jgi:hypothetical protein
MLNAKTVLLITTYLLAYLGLSGSISPTLMHWSHREAAVSPILQLLFFSVLAPFALALMLRLLASTELRGRRWPIATAPLVTLVVIAFLEDTIHKPYGIELLSLLSAGAVQGASAFLGWQICVVLRQRNVPTRPAASG